MGTIPKEIGNIKVRVHWLGTMSALSFLEVLNPSFNNLKGQIQLGTQLQSFTPFSYMCNPELCGTPLVVKCKDIEVPGGDTKNMAKEGSELMECFYMAMGVGFAIGFWIVFYSLLFNQSCLLQFSLWCERLVYIKMELKCIVSLETFQYGKQNQFINFDVLVYLSTSHVSPFEIHNKNN